MLSAPQVPKGDGKVQGRDTAASRYENHLSYEPEHFSDGDTSQTHVDLAQEITPLAGHINAINYRFIKLLADFDRQDGRQASKYRRRKKLENPAADQTWGLQSYVDDDGMVSINVKLPASEAERVLNAAEKKRKSIRRD